MTREKKYGNFIDGQWCDATDGKTYQVYSPGDRDLLIGEFPLSTEEDVRLAVEAADCSFQEWKDFSPSKRTDYLYRFCTLLEEHKDKIAEAVMNEQGKIYREALAEPERGIKETLITAGEALRLEGIVRPSDSPRTTNYAERMPIGVVAAITPWNMPVLTPLRKIIPALACGCTVVFKPASATALSAVMLAELFEKAELPHGAVNLIIGTGHKTGDALISNPLVRGISFTGSTTVGRHISRVASQNLTKVQLEMGGKNAAVVVDYKNLEIIAPTIVKAAFTNAGQRCTSISRVIVRNDQAKDLEKFIVEHTKAIKVGRGSDPSSDIGPVISPEALNMMEEYIESAISEGATILTGGKRLTGGIYDKGSYLEPTIITNVTKEMRVAKEEIFGPILVIMQVASAEEAIDVCNATDYGLTASLFTDDLNYTFDFEKQVNVGMVRINNLGVSGGNMPFGGWKNSGHGPFSIGSTTTDFYTNIKVIYRKY